MERKKCKCSLLQSTIVYINNSKKFTDKLLEVLNEFSNIVGHKVNREKLLVFLFISHDQLKNVMGRAPG